MFSDNFFKKVEKKSSIVIVIAEAAIASHNNLSILYFLPPSSCTSYFFPFLTLKSKGGVSYEFQFIIHYPKETVSKILPFNTLPDSNIGKRNIQFSIVIFWIKLHSSSSRRNRYLCELFFISRTGWYSDL